MKLRWVFENEYSCERCGEFIGSIDNAYYHTDADIILCKSCEEGS